MLTTSDKERNFDVVEQKLTQATGVILDGRPNVAFSNSAVNRKALKDESVFVSEYDMVMLTTWQDFCTMWYCRHFPFLTNII